MGSVIETVSWQRFEYPYERRVFLFPPLNEKLPVTEFSAKRLCCYWEAPIDSIILHFDCSALAWPESVSEEHDPGTETGIAVA
jgi:hypothetical protein